MTEIDSTEEERQAELMDIINEIREAFTGEDVVSREDYWAVMTSWSVLDSLLCVLTSPARY